MVDFQSRDTRRGPTVDDESESDSDAADSAPSSEDDATGAADDTAAGNSTDTDGASATSADPLAEETPTPDTETADSDPLSEDYGSAADGTDEDPLADATASASHSEGDTETGSTAADTDQTAADTDQATPATATSQPATPSRAVDVAVVTVSGDRAALEDSVTGAFEAAGHTVVRRERLRGGYDAIQQMVDTLVDRDAVDVVVTVGGVGLAADDMAIEAVHPLLEKALPGFGEAFRARLADHVGTGIVGVRSTAGISDGTLVFCLPGDTEAAELAVGEILATEAPVLVDQLDG